MALPIKRVQIIKPIEVADIKIIPDSDANVLTYLVLHDNLEISIEKELIKIGTTYKLPFIKSNHLKLIWQKAQQQLDSYFDKRYNKPFEDDGAYAD